MIDLNEIVILTIEARRKNEKENYRTWELKYERLINFISTNIRKAAQNGDGFYFTELMPFEIANEIQALFIHYGFTVSQFTYPNAVSLTFRWMD